MQTHVEPWAAYTWYPERELPSCEHRRAPDNCRFAAPYQLRILFFDLTLLHFKPRAAPSDAARKTNLVMEWNLPGMRAAVRRSPSYI